MAWPTPQPRFTRDRDIRDEAVRLVREAAEPLPGFEDEGFGALFDRFGAARVVLLGEASHGTAEFYQARAAITRRLIKRHGVTTVALEADWPDAARLDAYVRHRQPAPAPEDAFARFPTWMWRNAEFAAFVEWLRAHNGGKPAEEQVAIRGLDLYSLDASIRAVLDYLDKTDPSAAALARERYGCLTPWRLDPPGYGRAALSSGMALCEQEVARMLADLLERRLDYAARDDAEGFLDATHNARLVRAAERYYRVMYYGGPEAWNLRDRHMFDTLHNVLAARGAQAKAVVWAHNSHIGNAAATEMGDAGEFNLGELCRRSFGDRAVLIGFGTDCGTVAAADNWDGPMRVMRVRRARGDSYEGLCRDAVGGRFLLDLGPRRHPEAVAALAERRLERAIGVIYRPESERWSHYFEAELPGQFDAWVWLEETSAVTPLPAGRPQGVPDTWPFGV